MYKLLIFSIAILSISAFAERGKSFKIAGKHYGFINKEKLLVSKSCLDSSCIAFKRTKSLKSFKIKQDNINTYAEALSAYVCKYEIKGQPILGIDSEKNMKSFCYFKDDNSMIEMNSLEEVAKLKLKN